MTDDRLALAVHNTVVIVGGIAWLAWLVRLGWRAWRCWRG